MKKAILLSGLMTSAILLVGCAPSKQPMMHQNNQNDSNYSAVGERQASSNQSDAKSESADHTLWNANKDQQLADFMNDWAPTMHQSYQKYDGTNQLKTSSGTLYPQDLNKVLVNHQKVSIGWSPDGKGSNEYNVVAIYNDNTSPVEFHITYLFTFHDGKPEVLVDQSTNGDIQLFPTKNEDVQSHFAKIANQN